MIEEKNSLLKIKKEQNRALDFLNNEGEYDKKVIYKLKSTIWTNFDFQLKQVTEELRKAKEEYRKENELFIENDKAMKKLHEKIIVMEEKCRDIQKKLKDKKSEKPKSQGVLEVIISEIEA